MVRRSRLPSLRNLALTFGAGAIALVIATVLVGGAGIIAWQRASSEALRINLLVEETQAVRGALYRQMKEVFDAVFLDDPDARAEYRAREAEVTQHLARLRRIAAGPEELSAVARLSEAYDAIRGHTDGMIADWPRLDLDAKRRILESELEQTSLRSFEHTFAELESQLGRQGQALGARLRLLAWLSPLLLALPMIGAAGLLLWSRIVLRRAIIEPVMAVQAATGMISRGELEHRVPEVGAAELQQLAASVNRMAGDLAESRESLVRAERQSTLAALVPVVAHNIRNPLASIRATAQVISDPALPGDVRDGLDGIIAASDRLERWTHALLSYLHPLEPQRSRCTAGELVDNIGTMLQPRLDQKGLTLDTAGWDRALALAVDIQLLEQALHGLVLNAIEASPDGATIRLNAIREGNDAVLAVEDQGGGMPFTPEARGLTPGPSTKRLGTGLGIPFAAKVVEVHGGTLRFETSPAGGTRVRITLPTEAAA
jgi:signal transduction histidine kinase